MKLSNFVVALNQKPDKNLEGDVIMQKNTDMFVLVEASELSLEDDFMRHEPSTENETKFKKHITKVIMNGVKDFYRPKIDPSFSEAGDGICYIPGKMPAVGMTYDWWKDKAIAFDKERKSRLGTKDEYVAFVGVLMKELVSVGWKAEEFWRIACNNSTRLGHYYNERSATRGEFETTGSREVCGFFDLANTYKMLAEDDIFDCYWLAGGSCNDFSYFIPVANLEAAFDFDYKKRGFGVGWLVLEK